MRLLVTGCTGFVGWKVSELLLREGHDVVGIDNFDRPGGARLQAWRLGQIRQHPGFSYFRVDINDVPELARFWASQQGHPFQSVVHLAARAGVRQSIDDPHSYYQTNVTGTLNVLELCRQRGVQKFVFASTSSVYGAADQQKGEERRALVQPMSEDMRTDLPLSPYAASKKAAELLCYVYHRLHGLDITVLRPFTAYGPAGRPDMAVFRFVKAIMEDEQVTVYGDGAQQRDFTYIDDVARGALLAVKPLGYAIINLGSARPVAVRDVIAQIEKLAGKQAMITCQPSSSTEPGATWASIAQAKRLLGWAPETSLEEGLQRTVEWYQENRSWAKFIGAEP